MISEKIYQIGEIRSVPDSNTTYVLWEDVTESRYYYGIKEQEVFAERNKNNLHNCSPLDYFRIVYSSSLTDTN